MRYRRRVRLQAEGAVGVASYEHLRPALAIAFEMAPVRLHGNQALVEDLLRNGLELCTRQPGRRTEGKVERTRFGSRLPCHLIPERRNVDHIIARVDLALKLVALGRRDVAA